MVSDIISNSGSGNKFLLSSHLEIEEEERGIDERGRREERGNSYE